MGLGGMIEWGQRYEWDDALQLSFTVTARPRLCAQLAGECITAVPATRIVEVP